MGDSERIGRLVIVDDEPDVRASIDEYFTLNGFDVVQAGNGADLKTALADAPVDVVLLDLRLPGEDGFTLCRALRESGQQMGIIMLTGAADTVDKVVGLEMGADDYVAKPFELRELLARVKSVRRRVAAPQPTPAMPTPPPGPDASPPAPPHPAAELAPPSGPDTVLIGAFTLNLATHVLHAPDGQPVPLTGMEFDLLRVFTSRPNRVLSRDQLLEAAHNKDWEPFDRSIDVRITRLRKKIEDDPAKPRLIRTVRGAGYMFCPAPT